MAEYIEREALETALNHRLNFLMAENGEYGHYTSGFDEAVTRVEDFPNADVAPVVHACWVARFDGPYKRRRCYCSHCGKHNGVGGIAQNQEKPYCPNCGAKMDKGDNNDECVD